MKTTGVKFRGVIVEVTNKPLRILWYTCRQRKDYKSFDGNSVQCRFKNYTKSTCVERLKFSFVKFIKSPHS